MDAVQTLPLDSTNPVVAPKPKPPKRRFSKLTAAEIAGLPGVSPVPVKKTKPDLVYYLHFMLRVTGPIGSVSDATQVHDFAYQLDVQAKSKGVGEVTAVSFTNEVSEVVVTLKTVGEQASHGAPASNAFVQLKDFLSTASVLNQGPAGKPAIWKAKVNGTTIVDGSYRL